MSSLSYYISILFFFENIAGLFTVEFDSRAEGFLGDVGGESEGSMIFRRALGGRG